MRLRPESTNRVRNEHPSIRPLKVTPLSLLTFRTKALGRCSDVSWNWSYDGMGPWSNVDHSWDDVAFETCGETVGHPFAKVISTDSWRGFLLPNRTSYAAFDEKVALVIERSAITRGKPSIGVQ